MGQSKVKFGKATHTHRDTHTRQVKEKEEEPINEESNEGQEGKEGTAVVYFLRAE